MILTIWLTGFAISCIQIYRSNASIPKAAYAITLFIWPLNAFFWVMDIVNFVYNVYYKIRFKSKGLK